MPFFQGAPLIQMLNAFRVCWVMGRYGGGKTSNSLLLAHELYQTGKYRYILGNFNSVWTDNPETVELREGRYVDAIVILDEGGLFMRLNRDADAFMLGLRKLNITILVPSVLPPAQRVKFLQIQRTMDFGIFGLPFWLYEYRLSLGSEKEKSYYGYYKPSEIYGIYDTFDYPMDDAYLSDWLEYWMLTARASRPAWCTWGPPPEIEGSKKGRENRSRRATGEDRNLDELRGLVEEIADGQAGVADIVSTYADDSAGGRRRNRR